MSSYIKQQRWKPCGAFSLLLSGLLALFTTIALEYTPRERILFSHSAFGEYTALLRHNENGLTSHKASRLPSSRFAAFLLWEKAQDYEQYLSLVSWFGLEVTNKQSIFFTQPKRVENTRDYTISPRAPPFSPLV